ncbi:MAG: hypothetical protein WBH87_07330, partial [Acetivibrionales bacterium]
LCCNLAEYYSLHSGANGIIIKTEHVFGIVALLNNRDSFGAEECRASERYGSSPRTGECHGFERYGDTQHDQGDFAQ